jgi:hypothetical protein
MLSMKPNPIIGTAAETKRMRYREQILCENTRSIYLTFQYGSGRGERAPLRRHMRRASKRGGGCSADGPHSISCNQTIPLVLLLTPRHPPIHKTEHPHLPLSLCHSLSLSAPSALHTGERKQGNDARDRPGEDATHARVNAPFARGSAVLATLRRARSRLPPAPRSAGAQRVRMA